MNIPALYPDEHVLGWRGRIKFFNHYPTVEITIDALRDFLDRHQLSDRPLQKRTSQLIILASISKMSLREFAYRHSFLPFVRAFGPDTFENIDDAQRTRSTIRYWMQLGKDGSWFCVSCANEDLEICGIPYWRRTHQLLGVDWCYKHQHKLRAVFSKDAFDIAPPIAKANDCLIPDGPNSINDADPIVQRYALIAKAMLERTVPLDLRKTVTLLRDQFSAVTHLDHLHRPHINIEIENRIPPYWRSRFSSLRIKMQGNDIFNFQKLLNQTHTPLDTERYVMALAFLFETSDAALRNLDLSKNIEIEKDNLKFEEKIFWWREDVLHGYVENQGCHTSFSSKSGLNHRLASIALAAHGLPNFGEESQKQKKAMQAFFEGESLANACQMYEANAKDVEDLLRIAGIRLANGLQKMDRTK